MNKPVYLDYAATTPVDPRVAEKMARCLTADGNFGNPASRSHLFGWQAESAVENARRQVAQLLHCDPREIVWTSGATEADNLAIIGAARARREQGNHIITSAIEHKAVLDTCEFLETQGFEVTYLAPDSYGRISSDSLKHALTEQTILVSLMHVNNELGVINDIAELGKIVRSQGALFHVDAAQSAGKLAIHLDELCVDLMSFSAHKIYGPKGIGALYVRRSPEVKLEAQIHGGGHERGMRSGTLATHQIVGMGEAFAIAAEEMESEADRLASLRKRFLDRVLASDRVCLNTGDAQTVPGIMNLSFGGVDGEVLLMALKDIAVSSGSACASASMAPSYVLKAIGLSDENAQGSIRFSLGRFTTEQEVDTAADCVVHVLETVAVG